MARFSIPRWIPGPELEPRAGWRAELPRTEMNTRIERRSPLMREKFSVGRPSLLFGGRNLSSKQRCTHTYVRTVGRDGFLVCCARNRCVSFPSFKFPSEITSAGRGALSTGACFLIPSPPPAFAVPRTEKRARDRADALSKDVGRSRFGEEGLTHALPSFHTGTVG